MFTTQPTGLYGWIKSNDGRSLGLFFGFLLAVQLLAIPSLFFPLLLFDSAHAPFLAWGGYGLRYAPLVLVASVVWFGWKYWWHIETVKRAVGFHFVDNADEPYLCAVIEPLIVMWGLPVPFVGVIESPARNAFACGVGRKKAVVVVTRGLIDHLTREELSCVLAHELSHIKNGDIRLMAAANIFMTALTDMHRSNPMRMTPIHAVLAIAVPAVLPITLLGNLLGAVAVRAGQMSRLLIASKREFIADAEAVQLTKNPGAMASALIKVEHDYRLKGLRSVDDSMMIAGDTEGDNATHPTVAQRIAALARTTGSMVFNSPHSPAPDAFATNPSLSEAEAAALLRKLPEARPLARIRRGARESGLTADRMGQVATVVAVAALLALHWPELGQPAKILAKFDARPLTLMLGGPFACTSGLTTGEACAPSAGAYEAFEGQRNTLVGYLAERSRARREAGHSDPDLTLASLARPGGERAEWRGQSGRLTGVTVTYADPGRTSYSNGDGTISNRVPEALTIAELEQVGCYPATFVYYNPKGEFAMLDDRRLGYDITRFEANATGLTIARGEPGSADEADWLRDYVDQRQTLLTFSYSNWGLPGLQRMQAAFDQPGHAAVLARMAARLAEPGFAAPMKPIERAAMRSLVARPQAFLPCPALKHMPAA